MGFSGGRTVNPFETVRKVFVFLLILSSIDALAQYGRGTMYDKKRADAFPEPLQYKMTGWYFGIGPTFMPPQQFFLVKDIATSSSALPSTKIGLFIEIGRYKIFEYPGIFRYMDYGLAYKSLRCSELSAGNSFGDHYIEGHYNLNNRIKVSRSSFIQNTLGIDAEYAIVRNNSTDAPPAFVSSLHYKIGFGYKVNKKLMIIPSVETPLITFYPLEYGSSSLGYGTSRFRPMIISLRFLILRPKMDECPYVPPPPGGLPTDQNGGSNDGGME